MQPFAGMKRPMGPGPMGPQQGAIGGLGGAAPPPGMMHGKSAKKKKKLADKVSRLVAIIQEVDLDS